MSYRIQRAIIMAAGLGNRMRPLTEAVPKPLIKVNGVPMIETVINALKDNDINEIKIVVGYKKEQFEYLKSKYDNVELIENPYYSECNNISSLFVARDYIENSIILDGDQIIYNPKILFTDFDYSGYSAVWNENESDEWMLTVDDNSFITKCSRNGGSKAWQLFSVSRWTADDGIKLKKYLETEFITKNNRGIYWDDVAMFEHFDEFKLGIYKIESGDIVEIDNIEELADIDKSYEKYRRKQNEE